MSELGAQWQEPFRWLTEQWRGSDQPWSELRDGFLEQLGLQDSSADPEVENLFRRIDEELTSEDERWRTLTDESAREQFFPELYPESEQADDEVAPSDEPERYWNGERWYVLDAERQEWVPEDGEVDDDAGGDGGGEVADEVADEEDGGAGEADTEEPAVIVGGIVDDIAAPALAEAVAAVPELAGRSADELNALLSDVLAERLAAAGGS